MVETQSSAVVPQKVYRPNRIWNLWVLFILLLGIGLGVLLLVAVLRIVHDTASLIVLCVGAPIPPLIGIFFFLGFQRVRLVTSSQGVLLYSVGYKVYTPWNNIKELGTDWYGGNNAYSVRTYQPARELEGFLFYRPATFGISVEEGIKQQIPVIQGMALLAVQMSRYTHMLPLTLFLNEQTRQELIEDGQKYAPETFQTKKPLYQYLSNDT